jgi:ammonia channel protein AmtB
MVTSKSVSVICAKNIGLYAISGIMFWLVGYNLAYGIPEGGYIGTFTPWSDSSSLEAGYSAGSDWFSKWYFVQQQFQFVQEQWLKELNYGHSFYLQQFYLGVVTQ